jgi:hypothetical protein
MVIWPEASNAQKSIAAVSRRQNGLRLDPPLELFAQAFDGIRASNRFPLALREAREGEKPVARFIPSCRRPHRISAATTKCKSRQIALIVILWAK